MKRFLFLILAALLLVGPVTTSAQAGFFGFTNSDVQSPTVTRRVSTLSDLKLLTGKTAIQSVQLMGRVSEDDGGEGVFMWLPGDQSANALVLVDTLEGALVKPTTPGDGSTGVWVRQHEWKILAAWFGAQGGDSSDNSVPINAAIDYTVAIVGGHILLPSGIINIDNPIAIPSVNGTPLTIEGAGADRNDMDLGTSIHSSVVDNMIEMTTPCQYVTLKNFSLRSLRPIDDGVTGIKAKAGVSGFVSRCRFELLGFKNLFYGIDLFDETDDGFADGMFIENIKFETVRRCIKLKHPDATTINAIVAEPFTDYVFYIFQAGAVRITDVLARGINGNLDTNRAIVAIVIGTEAGEIVRGNNVTFEGFHVEAVNSLGYISCPKVTFSNIHYHNVDTGDQPRDHMFRFFDVGGSAPINCKLENIFYRSKDTRDGGTFAIYAPDFFGESVDYIENTQTSNTTRTYGLRVEGWEPETTNTFLGLVVPENTLDSSAADVGTLKRDYNKLVSDLRVVGALPLVQRADSGVDHANWGGSGGFTADATGVTLTGASATASLLMDFAPGRVVTVAFEVVSNTVGFLSLSANSFTGTSINIFGDLEPTGLTIITEVASDTITDSDMRLKFATSGSETGSIKMTNFMIFDGDQTQFQNLTGFIDHGESLDQYPFSIKPLPHETD